jgi:hypothetical protein
VRRLPSAGILASAVLVLVAVVLAIVGGGDEPSYEEVDGSPRLAEVEDLRALEEELGHPVYWVGERPPARLELQREPNGSVFLRYLPPDAQAGERPGAFLTVGTYPVPEAEDAVERGAAEAGAAVERAAGGVAFESPSRQNAYLAYPGSDLQIEVYDPRPGRALGLIRAGAVEPVGE